MGSLVLRRVTLVDGTVTDVRLRDGVIDSVGLIEPGPADEVLDLSGYLLTAAAVEPHATWTKPSWPSGWRTRPATCSAPSTA